MLLLYNEENKIIGITSEKKKNTIEYNGNKRIPYQSLYKKDENVLVTPDGENIHLTNENEQQDFILEEI
jgi:hypothetical protein